VRKIFARLTYNKGLVLDYIKNSQCSAVKQIIKLEN
jgi:hypothetical protein